MEGDSQKRATGPRNRVAITGSSGMVGQRLVEALGGAGHTITRLVRDRSRSRRAGHIYWSPARGEIEARHLEDQDVVIHLAGESIRGLWTPTKKRRIRQSRIRGTRLLAETLARLDRKPSVLLSASGVDYYGGHAPHERVGEDAPAGSTFLANVVKDWEAATRPAAEAGIRVVCMRFGLVLSPRGGLLGTALPAFRLGLGAKLGDGRQILSWIALDDLAAAIRFLIPRDDIEGPVNMVAPNAVSNAEFTETLGSVLGRPTLLSVPSLVLRLLGDLGEVLRTGARVVPARLLEAGYPFRHPTLREALESMLT